MNDNLIKRHAYYNKKWFDQWAKIYDITSWFMQRLRKKAARVIELFQGARVLDVATGTGEQALALAKLGYSVIGIDLSRKMLEKAKSKIDQLDLQFLEADANKLPFKDNSFEAVFISLGLHDMPYKISQIVLKEMRRVVKFQGKIVVVEYKEPSQGVKAYFFCKIAKLWERKLFDDFIRRGLKSILADAELKIIREEDYCSLFQIVVCE